MRFTKPAWVMHGESATKSEQNPKRLSIFSVHVHPDGSRIATGGLDAKVRIWSTKPILNHTSELSNRPPKSLSTLSMHTGPVLAVRWAFSGRWLASGSDDMIVMIWDLDPAARGKVWGSDEVNVEGWKPLKRLPGHESDITDLAWAPGDRYLASVGLDSKVLIWCGFTLDRLRTLDLHRGFVKGVCWDPVGEFLATASDDRSVKIWRTQDWTLEAEVEKPFEASPGTFFRRLSWSPDGAHITASNATNNQGFVFIAAVIARNAWTSEISLVGHENTVEVSCYNPHIFLRNPQQPVVTSNICSVVALGGDDRSVSVWQTKSARPIIVAKEVFERQILDLSWSMDGLTLYAVSSDGTMGVFSFDADEMEGISPLSAQKDYLKKFGYELPPLPTGFSHNQLPKEASASQMTPPPSPSGGKTGGQPNSQHFGTMVNGSGANQVNKLVAKRNNKKRLQPKFVGLLAGPAPSASASVPSTLSSQKTPRPQSSNFPHGITSDSFDDPAPSAGMSTSIPVRSGSPLQSPSMTARSRLSSSVSNNFTANDGFDDIEMLDAQAGSMQVPISSLTADDPAGIRGKKRISVMDLVDDGRQSKARTLGGDRTREKVAVKEILGGGGGVIQPNLGALSASAMLHVPSLLNYLSVKVDGSQDLLEAHNSEDSRLYEVIYVSGKQTQWLDFLPSPIFALTGTKTFCAVAMLDGCLNVYSPTGRRLMPTLSLGSTCAFLNASNHMLMAIASSGLLHVWNIKKQQAAFAPASILPLLDPNTELVSAVVNCNGAPVVHLSTGCAYSYDTNLLAWIKLGDKWWANGSSAWQGRQRSGSSVSNRGVVSSIESTIGEQNGGDGGADIQRPAWWEAALTLGHLETRLQASITLDSPIEYKQALLVYAKKIADEGFRAKAEELVKELFGPLYWRPGRDDSWSPHHMGFAKRELLREVLNIFARSKTLTKLALDWQDMLRKASNDE